MRVLLTGAGGGMGFASFQAMLPDLGEKYELVLLLRDSKKNRGLFRPWLAQKGLRILWGDLLHPADVERAVAGADIVLHVAALVSPQADYCPEQAMRNNFGSTRNIVEAIRALDQAEKTRLVYIGTVAETGDRMPPIHWGRVGDPIKPSMFDYYAVSKVASERYVIESGLKYWVSLRQTGIIGPAMAAIRDGIQFHNCLDNVLEYVSDRDSGRAMRNLCAFTAGGTLDEAFWGHIYNIGGGASCRVSTLDMYKVLYGEMGFTSLDPVIEPKWNATRNFHGQYYLDSDKLEDYLHFRSDSMQHLYDAYLQEVKSVRGAARALCRLPGGERLMGSVIRSAFRKLMLSENGTMRWIRDGREDRIDAYWGGRAAWEALPEKCSDMVRFTDWDTVVPIDHGYDETKPESALTREDVAGAAHFRGGELLSGAMATGDWRTKLRFRCAFGHEFDASPRLVLEGGHWCPECERKSWNYGKRAQVDPFFAQVWDPLRRSDELREYPKLVSELEV